MTMKTPKLGHDETQAPLNPAVPVLMRAAKRDASWYAYPGTAWQYHIVVGDLLPACNPQGALLTEETARPAEEVAEDVRCRRPGCRVRWPKGKGARP